MTRAEGLSRRTAGAIATFLTSLAVYLLTLAPTVTFVDSGELILATRSLGVAHPPGFPLYLILTHLASIVPFGSIATRVNFASALYGALAAVIIFLLVIETLSFSDPGRDRKPTVHSKKKRAKGRAGVAASHEMQRATSSFPAALLAALAFAFSRTLWSFATVAEVYTLNTLLIAAVCFLMFRWRATNNPRFIYGAAFVFALGLGVHHVTVGVILPALAVFVYRSAGWQFFKSAKLLYCALISIGATVLVYSYLPLAAQRMPVMNWGDPRTLQKFWFHITGHQYQVFLTFSPEQILNQASQFAWLAIREFGWPWLPLPLLLAAVGAFHSYRRDRTSFWFFLLIALADVAYSLNYEIAEDKGAYYLPAFISAAVAMGVGTRFVLSAVTRRWPRSYPFAATAVLMLTVIGVTFAGNYRISNRHNFYLARDYVTNIERPIASGGMLLTTDWQVYSPLLYLRELEQQRRDVVAIDLNLLRRSWYFDYLTAQYPDLIANNQAVVQSFLSDLRHWEQDPELFARSPDLTQQINDHFHQMIRSFIQRQLNRAPAYVTWEVGVGMLEDADISEELNKDYRLVPEGLVFRLGSEQDFQQSTQPQLITRGLDDGSFTFAPDDVVEQKVRPAYVTMLVNRGRYLEVLGKSAEAAEFYRAALRLDPNSAVAQSALTSQGHEIQKR